LSVTSAVGLLPSVSEKIKSPKVHPRFYPLTTGRSPVQDAKAVKNEVEKEGMRQCHIRDGTALVEYFSWLENELQQGNSLDEVETSDKLEQFRRYNP
jgi:Xaa-Pro aminopeptidase